MQMPMEEPAVAATFERLLRNGRSSELLPEL
jgi:hypothetical protein